AVLSDALDLQELLIDLVADRAQVIEVLQSLAGVEIPRVVDSGLRAKGAVLFEVLLDVRTLVGDVQAGIDALRDDARAVPVQRGGRAAGRALRGQKTGPIGPAESEVVSDDFGGEVWHLDRLVEG